MGGIGAARAPDLCAIRLSSEAGQPDLPCKRCFATSGSRGAAWQCRRTAGDPGTWLFPLSRTCAAWCATICSMRSRASRLRPDRLPLAPLQHRPGGDAARMRSGEAAGSRCAATLHRPPSAWHYLTGPPSVRPSRRASGSAPASILRLKQFLHPAGIVFLTPHGHGVSLSARRRLPGR